MAAFYPNIYPILRFDKEAEEAAKFYTSIFKNSKILNIQRVPGNAVEPFGFKPGEVTTVFFELIGSRFIALNGRFTWPADFTTAIAFAIQSDTLEEMEYYRKKLREGGNPDKQCGPAFIVDKFGVTWYLNPVLLLDGNGIPTGLRMPEGATLPVRDLSMPSLQLGR